MEEADLLFIMNQIFMDEQNLRDCVEKIILFKKLNSGIITIEEINNYYSPDGYSTSIKIRRLYQDLFSLIKTPQIQKHGIKCLEKLVWYY